MRQFITVIKSCLHFILLVAIVHPITSAEVPSTDPCEAGPCGKGAECKSMGSIAICVCPNDGKGDPFVTCMPREEEPSLAKPGSTVGQEIIASVHHTRSAATKVTTAKPSGSSTSSTTEKAMMTSTTTSTPLSTASTTRNPYVYVYQPTTERYPGADGNRPESHRIPIISGGSNQDIYPQHNQYPSRPNFDGGDTRVTSPGYQGSGALAGSSYELFKEKTSSDYPVTGYPYRGSTGFYNGQGTAYEYDSRPIRPPSSMGHHHHTDRYGHHGYHPSASGFPAPITEASRYPPSSGSSYDVYNYNPIRNEIGGSSSHDGAYSRIADPLGKYENCRVVNGIVVCADSRNSFMYNHPQYPSHHGGDVMSSTANYGFHSSRDRDQYSAYYPSRYTTYPTSSDRPSFDYNYVNRQGYPEHGSRPHIDNDYASSHGHPFFPRPQNVPAPSVVSIAPMSNDNENPRCKSMCGVNSVCRLVLDRPVCGCPEGHTGDPSVRCSPVYSERSQRRDDGSMSNCERHVDCKESEICAKNQCVDPCKHQDQMSSSTTKIDGRSASSSICGTNSECVVVGHTPLCKCNEGYFGNPYVSCAA